MVELKGCPFCGAALFIRHSVNSYGRCETPGCWVHERKVTVPLDDPTEVAAWNRRPSPPLPDDAAALVARLFAAIAHGDEAHRAWLKNALNAFFELPENMPSLAAPVGDAGGWIAGSADGNRFRTWKDGYAAWTDDRNEATRYARRIDAEAVHAEDEDAWRVLPLAAPRPVGEELVEVVAEAMVRAINPDLDRPGSFRWNVMEGMTNMSEEAKERWRVKARAALRSLPSRDEVLEQAAIAARDALLNYEWPPTDGDAQIDAVLAVIRAMKGDGL